ncbi:TRI7 [Apiospora aurea]|uniref:TRI7 n=1 Tax=Apiospora aurea TaxID=335848 RepID=A0ABR1PZE0_9PEZI
MRFSSRLGSTPGLATAIQRHKLTLTEAYPLRRFWAINWHRLHVASFTSFMPPTLRVGPEGAGNGEIGLAFAALRTLWMFTMSAFSHAAANWFIRRNSNFSAEVGFFLLNCVVCTQERLVEKKLLGIIPSGVRGWLKPFGYVWVLLVFSCIVPIWQYPLIYGS